LNITIHVLEKARAVSGKNERKCFNKLKKWLMKFFDAFELLVLFR
jgi:hypothetical protein